MYGRGAVRETGMSEERERCSQDVLSEKKKIRGIYRPCIFALKDTRSFMKYPVSWPFVAARMTEVYSLLCEMLACRLPRFTIFTLRNVSL